jgi:hypothetical protein
MAKKSLISKIADAVLGPDEGPTRPHPAVFMDGNIMPPSPPAPNKRKLKKAKASSKKRVAKKPATKKKR